MNEQTNELLRDLAARLGTTTEYLWAVLVAGQRVEGIASLSLGVALLAVAVASCVLIHRGLILIDYYQTEDRGFAYALGGAIVGATTTLIGIYSLYDAGRMLLAPEYMALKSLLSMIGN